LEIASLIDSVIASKGLAERHKVAVYRITSTSIGL
jgi:hypothetical protein